MAGALGLKTKTENARLCRFYKGGTPTKRTPSYGIDALNEHFVLSVMPAA